MGYAFTSVCLCFFSSLLLSLYHFNALVATPSSAKTVRQQLWITNNAARANKTHTSNENRQLIHKS
jgi:hypothetical protein